MEKPQEVRQKLRMMEVLLAAYREARTTEWFEGKVPPNDQNREDRAEATKVLLQVGLLEKDDDYPGPGHPHPYRLTAKGFTFVEDVRKMIGTDRSIDWNRVHEIEFPSP